MTTKIQNFLMITGFALTCLSSGAKFGYSMGETAHSNEVKKLAIANQCGRYDATTGEFEWVRPVTAENVIMDYMPQETKIPEKARPMPLPPKSKPKVHP